MAEKAPYPQMPPQGPPPPGMQVPPPYAPIDPPPAYSAAGAYAGEGELFIFIKSFSLI